LHGIEIVEKLKNKLGLASNVLVWERMLFGDRPAPLYATRMFLRAIEMAKRSRYDTTSAFCWDHVRLNLPSAKGYDPALPRVAKIWADGLQATDEISFVDDERVVGATEELVKLGTRQIAAGIQERGVQEASRKRRKVDQRNGAWAGHVVYTDMNADRKFTTQKKWDKGIECARWIALRVDNDEDLPFKEFRSKASFLVHLASTYSFLKPYTKGLFLTLNSWRDDRDEEGWKIFKPAAAMKSECEDELFEDWCEQVDEEFQGELQDPTADKPSCEDIECPEGIVRSVPRLSQDIQAIRSFLEQPKPVMVLLRPCRGQTAVAYGFVDASGEGFGGSTRYTSAELMLILKTAQIGFWCSEISEKSSNYREFWNAVEHIKHEGRSGKLAGMELIIFGDNEVTERAWFNGTSSSPELFDLVLELRHEEIIGNFVITMIHISGERMIREGTDALSRGEVHARDLMNSVLHTVPLNEAPCARFPLLREWVRSWAGEDVCFATPEHWFEEATQQHEYHEVTKTWVWDLPPAAAIHAIEELGMGRGKRHNVLRGIVLVPRLLKPEWFRRFARLMDCYFVVPAGTPFWGREMLEPLFVGLYLPLLRYRPWDWSRVPLLVAFGRKMSSMLKEDREDGGDLLRELWLSAIWIQNMPELLVSDLLSDGHYRRLLGVAKKGSCNWTRGCG
jgi:hypothetical protein